MRNRLFVVVALVTIAAFGLNTILGHSIVSAQEPLGVMKDTLQITALTRNGNPLTGFTPPQ